MIIVIVQGKEPFQIKSPFIERQGCHNPCCSAVSIYERMNPRNLIMRHARRYNRVDLLSFSGVEPFKKSINQPGNLICWGWHEDDLTGDPAAHNYLTILGSKN